MFRRIILAIALACVAVGMLSSRTLAQPPAEPATPPSTAAVMALLKQTIETKGFTEPMKLRKAIEIISDKFGGKLGILADVEAYRIDPREIDVDPYDVDVILPEQPAKMPL